MRNSNMSKYRVFTTTPWDRKSASYYTLLAFVSAFYAVVFDYVRIDTFAIEPKDAAILVLCSASYCLPLVFALMLSRWVFVLSAPLLFYIGAVGRIYTEDYLFDTGTKTAPLFFDNTVISAMAKNPDNAAFIGGMFALGLAVGLVRFFYAKDTSVIRRGQAFAVMLVMTAAATTYIRENYKPYLPQPYAYIASMQQYLNDKAYYMVFNSARSETEVTGYDNVTGVVIFIDKLAGLAADNMTELTYKSGNLKPNFGIDRHNTLSALTGASTQMPQGITLFPTIISVFNKADYDTFWITVSDKFAIKDSYINRLAKSESQNYIIKENNGSPNPFLALTELSNFMTSQLQGLNIMNIDGKEMATNGTASLLVINIEGTAPKISKRYNNIFRADVKVNSSNVQTDYRNYVSSLDVLLSETKKRLEGRNAFIILMGISGEEISNTNDFRAGKGDNPPSVFGLWLSPKLEKKVNTETIKEKLKDATSPDMIYHTTIGCAGIKTTNLDNTKNLCDNGSI